MAIAYGDSEAVVLEDAEMEFAISEVDEVDEFAETDGLQADALTDPATAEKGSQVEDFLCEGSVIFDVDDIVAEFEAESVESDNPSSRLRRRLDAIAERKRRHNDLMDFCDYDIGC